MDFLSAPGSVDMICCTFVTLTTLCRRFLSSVRGQQVSVWVCLSRSKKSTLREPTETKLRPELMLKQTSHCCRPSRPLVFCAKKT